MLHFGRIPKKFGYIWRKFSNILAKFANFWEKSRKKKHFLTKILRLENGGFDSKTVQRSALCRSRRELSNEYLLAKFGFDTAENEPLKVRITDHTFDHIPSVLYVLLALLTLNASHASMPCACFRGVEWA